MRAIRYRALLRRWAFDPYYAQADEWRETAAGTAELTGTERHPDPLAEAIRWQICEGELIQLVGRGRGVNRTEANPLDVFLLTDIPLPLPIDRTITAAELKMTIAETQLAAGGAAFAIPAHAVHVYPDMWVSLNAARIAFNKEAREIQSVSFPNIRLLIGERHTLESWAYQLAGARQHPAKVTIDRSVIADPEAYLTATLGKLAFCRVATAEAEAADVAAVIPVLEVEHMSEPAPGALYRRRVLEPPPAYLLTIRGPGRTRMAEIDLPAMGPFMGFRPIMRHGPSPLLLMDRPMSSASASGQPHCNALQ